MICYSEVHNRDGNPDIMQMFAYSVPEDISLLRKGFLKSIYDNINPIKHNSTELKSIYDNINPIKHNSTELKPLCTLQAVKMDNGTWEGIILSKNCDNKLWSSIVAFVDWEDALRDAIKVLVDFVVPSKKMTRYHGFDKISTAYSLQTEAEKEFMASFHNNKNK